MSRDSQNEEASRKRKGAAWPTANRADAIEVLFDDGSDNPYAIHIGTEQIDRLPLDANVGQQVMCTVWTRGPNLALSLPARYRLSERLPDLRPWRRD